MGKIAVMDSGFGGLTVLKELLRVMPDEEYIFYGDSANAPYGDKTHDELLRLTSRICERLSADYDIDSFVIACNTTSSEVWDELTDRFPEYDFIGIEPALKQAVEENPGRRILVLATTATINGRRLKGRYAEFKDRADISLLAAPGIVPFVESCNTGSDDFRAYLEELLHDHKGRTDCVVLGCTHFPFVKNEIAEVLGHDIRFYDAAVNAAAEAAGINTDSGIPVRRSDMPGHAADGKIRSAHNADDSSRKGCLKGKVLYLNSDPGKVELEAKLLDMYASI